MAQFQVTINLGNAACETGNDVAFILKQLARQMEAAAGDHELAGICDWQEPHGLRDVNGNRVGSWEVKP